MGAALGEAELARVRRTGIAPISDERGLALFDQLVGADEPFALAFSAERPALREMAAAGLLPGLLRGIVRVPARRRSAAAASLAAKLAAAPEAERPGVCLQLVRHEVAAVLGHGSSAEVEPARAFKDLGFDSLAAVELRNRLDGVSGFRLPATVVFDYPNALALAEHLLSLATEGPAGGASASLVPDLDALEVKLSRIQGDEEREEAIERLRGLVAGLTRRDRADLSDASDEEMFAHLDSQLGPV